MACLGGTNGRRIITTVETSQRMRSTARPGQPTGKQFSGVVVLSTQYPEEMPFIFPGF